MRIRFSATALLLSSPTNRYLFVRTYTGSMCFFGFFFFFVCLFCFVLPFEYVVPVHGPKTLLFFNTECTEQRNEKVYDTLLKGQSFRKIQTKSSYQPLWGGGWYVSRFVCIHDCGENKTIFTHTQNELLETGRGWDRILCPKVIRPNPYNIYIYIYEWLPVIWI